MRLRPGRCGNVAALLELDEHLNKSYKIFEASPELVRHERCGARDVN